MKMDETLTRSELIARLAERVPDLSRHHVGAGVRRLLDTLSEALADGERIEIRSFGAFALRRRPSRQVRNPKTGERLEIGSKAMPHFRPGKELRERVTASALKEKA